jgi:hypothetical protein
MKLADYADHEVESLAQITDGHPVVMKILLTRQHYIAAIEALEDELHGERHQCAEPLSIRY